jgi:hypothetical protein
MSKSIFLKKKKHLEKGKMPAGPVRQFIPAHACLACRNSQRHLIWGGHSNGGMD